MVDESDFRVALIFARAAGTGNRRRERWLFPATLCIYQTKWTLPVPATRRRRKQRGLIIVFLMEDAFRDITTYRAPTRRTHRVFTSTLLLQWSLLASGIASVSIRRLRLSCLYSGLLHRVAIFVTCLLCVIEIQGCCIQEWNEKGSGSLRLDIVAFLIFNRVPW